MGKRGGPDFEVDDRFASVALRALILMMMADGKIRISEEDLVRRVFLGLHGVDPTEEQLEVEKAAARQAEESGLDAYLRTETDGWPEADRCTLLKMACLMAIADRELVRDERVLLIRFGRALELSAHQVRAVHDQLLEGF